MRACGQGRLLGRRPRPDGTEREGAGGCMYIDAWSYANAKNCHKAIGLMVDGLQPLLT